MTSAQAPGLHVAVHGHPNLDTLLLWHPAVRTDADAVGALASRIATRSGIEMSPRSWSASRYSSRAASADFS